MNSRAPFHLEASSTLRRAVDDLKSFKEKRQNVYDRLSENQQEGERGGVIEMHIEAVDNAIKAMENAIAVLRRRRTA